VAGQPSWIEIGQRRPSERWQEYLRARGGRRPSVTDEELILEHHLRGLRFMCRLAGAPAGRNNIPAA